MIQVTDLKEFRTALGLTQQALADKLGMSRKSVVEMENGGKIEPRTISHLEALRPRIDVAYSKALNGWTVAVTSSFKAGGTPGRMHYIAGRFDTEDEALLKAGSLMSEVPAAEITRFAGPIAQIQS